MKNTSFITTIIVISVSFCISCGKESYEEENSKIDSETCALDSLKYLKPPMYIDIFRFEHVSSDDAEIFSVAKKTESEPEEALLLVWRWHDGFADLRRPEEGHDIKSAVMYHLIDTEKDIAYLLPEESSPEKDYVESCKKSINMEDSGKKYSVDFCEVIKSYCNPPKNFDNNLIVQKSDGQEVHISLPLE